jgi:hypothetical protein
MKQRRCPENLQADNLAVFPIHERLGEANCLDRACNWPPLTGMTLEKNLADLRRHADDFARGAGFTFTVLDPPDNDVIAGWLATDWLWKSVDRCGR